MQDEDALTVVLKELGSTYPGLLRPLIEERDEFMVLSLRCLAREYVLVLLWDKFA